VVKEFVLYEDNHLIAVNKPAGMLTQPAEGINDSLENTVKEYLKNKYSKPGNVFLGVVHRLDRPVSGIVIFAKTSKALSRVNAMIRDREMRKTYCALVEGHLKEDSGILEHFLRHGDHIAHVCRPHDPGAKIARLHYKTLEKNETTTLLEIDLETGRYHQIRAQCAAVGCPIVGDAKYGSRTPFADGAIALHHSCLKLHHPVTKTLLHIECRYIHSG